MVISIELIQGCKQENKVAQKRLYSILLPYLNAVCRRYLSNPSDAKDALQEAFIKIFTNINQYDPNRGQFKTWVVRITINCALKFNEKMYRIPTKELIEDKNVQTIDPEILRKLSDEDLLTFLKRMPPNYFEVFNLHIIDGFSHKEIGMILGIDESLSRKRLSRARTWLSTQAGSQAIKNLGLRKLI